MRKALIAALVPIAACSSPPPPAPTVDAAVAYPSADELPERVELPALFDSFAGSRRVTTVADWEAWRRAELRDRFAHYIYGYAPAHSVAVTGRSTATIEGFLPGVARYEEVELTLGDGAAPRVHLSLYLPLGVASPAVFVALNKCGNQEVSADPRVTASAAWIDTAVCGASAEASRGARASNWPVEAILRRGYAFVTFHESDIDPDTSTDRDFSDGVHPHFVPAGRAPEVRWGRIAAWSWGLSRAVDWLVASGRVDASRIAVVGHSRRGKAALWAGANDDRIAMVIAHQSGTAGAALSRSPVGESVQLINLSFPSWFNDVFPTFGGRESRLPLDQHQLVALMAPRRLLLTDGDDDAWADPPGARGAAEAADPAWGLHGRPGLVRGADGSFSLEGRLSWRTRPGGHSLGAEDWETFLTFADRQWPR
jgi:hypothetical protein